MAILGGIGRSTYSPYLIEHYLGVADDLEKNTNQFAGQIVTIVTSQLATRENPDGYGRTITYDDGSVMPGPQTIIFYARRDQFIEIDITPNCILTDPKAVANASCGEYKVAIDGTTTRDSEKPMGAPERIRLTGADLPPATSAVGTDSHSLTVLRLGAHKFKEITSFDCLVLVSNREL